MRNFFHMMSVFGAIVLGLILVVTQFKYPDMTRTRLFLEFWYFYLAFFACLVLFAITEKRNR